MNWYYTNGRSKHGPIDEAGVRVRAEKGYITGDTLLWHEGLDGWKKASELGFASSASAPPPAGGQPSFASAAPSASAPRQEAAPQPSINVSVNTGSLETPVSVGNWFLTFIVMCIPVVNVIMLLVWAFGGSAHKSKSNWARAALLMVLIGVLGWLLFGVLLASAFRSAF